MCLIRAPPQKKPTSPRSKFHNEACKVNVAFTCNAECAYFSNVIAGLSGRTLLLKNWSMPLGSGIWYGSPTTDSGKAKEKPEREKIKRVKQIESEHNFMFNKLTLLTSNKPLAITVELFHCVLTRPCCFSLLKHKPVVK